MAKKNPKDRYLRQRTNSANWWYRRYYPKAQRATLGYALEVSLDTSDLTEARRRRDRLNLLFDAKVEAVGGLTIDAAKAEGEWFRRAVADNPDLSDIPTVLDDIGDMYAHAEASGDEDAMSRADLLADAFHGVKTWAEAGEEALAKYDLADNTAVSYRRAYNRADQTGLTPAAKLEREEAGRWLKDHASGKSKSWRNQHRSAFKLVTEEIRSSEDAEHIWDGHKVRVSKKSRGVRPVTLSERALILQHAGSSSTWMEPASLAAMALGLRQEELRDHAEITGGRVRLLDSKTTRGKRNFAVLPEVEKLLATRDDWPEARSIGALWGKAKRAAGLGEDVNWHSLRHTAIEIAMELEIPYEVRGGLFGHEQGRGSEKSYTHVSQARIDEAAEKLQREVLKRVKEPPVPGIKPA